MAATSRILVCLADSPHARAVLRAAKGIGQALGARVGFVHVARDEPETRRRLDEIVASEGLRSEEGLIIRDGRPDQVICAVAAELQADLLFAGALSREKMVRDLIGSTARRVARRSPCSVFLLVGSAEAPPFRRIVVSVEFDGTAHALMTQVVTLARAGAGAELHVINESTALGASLGEIAPAPQRKGAAIATLSDSVRLRLADLLETVDVAGIDLVTACVPGRAGVELVRYAQDVDADLLALSAPRRLGYLDRFFGHRVETVLNNLPCSLLLYRAPRR